MIFLLNIYLNIIKVVEKLENEPENQENSEKKEETLDLSDYIHKKIAANEVYQVLSKSNKLAWTLLAGLFCSVLLTRFYIYAGIAVAVIFSLTLGLVIFKNKQKMTYYEQQYGITPGKIQIEE